MYVRGLLGKTYIHLPLIAALGLIVYSNTFDVPFQWDEEFYIKKNPIVRDLSYFLHPSKAKAFEQYDALKGRYIGYLTFALNYRLHGLDVTGYHIFNITIHLFNAMLVYFFVNLTFKTPFMKGSQLKVHAQYIALFASLLFVAHPIQTEAVTYIFQRLASLTAFFYLLSIVLYVKWRLYSAAVRQRESATEQEKQIGGLSLYRSGALYLLSLLSTVLAMKTKENAFTLPITMALYEFFFFHGRAKKRMLHLTPFLLALIIIPITHISLERPIAEIIGGTSSASRGFGGISRMHYLFTEFRVVVTYMRLLFLPIDQTIGYDYPIFRSFLNPDVFLSFLFILSLLGLGFFFLRRRYRILAFGIFWFFITLSVESSTIPIPMVINEYRLYLPSVGVIIVATMMGDMFFKKMKDRKLKTGVLSLFILPIFIFSYAAYERNEVWRSEISLWEDTVSKSPNKPDTHINLARAYHTRGLLDEAMTQYQTAVRLNPDNAEVHYNIGLVYTAKGLIDNAIEHYSMAVKLKRDFTEAYNSLGNAYNSRGLIEKAIEYHRWALELNPGYALAYYNLGLDYWVSGQTDKAIDHLQFAIRAKPDYAEAYYNLGLIYIQSGRGQEAETAFVLALQVKPDYQKAQQMLQYLKNTPPRH